MNTVCPTREEVNRVLIGLECENYQRELDIRERAYRRGHRIVHAFRGLALLFLLAEAIGILYGLACLWRAI